MSRKNRFLTKKKLLSLAAAGLLSSVATPAFAQVASGNAFDLKVHVNVIGLIDFDLSPLMQVSMAPQSNPYSDSDSLNSYSNGNAAVSISTDLVSSEILWSPNPSQLTVGAEASAANVNIGVVGLLGLNLLNLHADQIRSMSVISGQCSQARAHSSPTQKDLGDVIGGLLYTNGFDEQSLLPIDNIDLPGLAISILDTAVPNLPLDPAPNTSIDLSALGLAGASLVLNERTNGGDGINSASSATNAVHVALDVASLATVDVVVGHTDLTVDCTQ